MTICGRRARIDEAPAQRGAKMQAHDEAGTSRIAIDIDISGYTVQTKGNAAAPAGNGTWTLQSLYTGSYVAFDPNDIATIVNWNGITCVCSDTL